MKTTTGLWYQPDTVSPPGETLQETLDTLGMTQAELAQRTGRPKKTINEIVQGKTAITPETALQLERVLGVPADFWNRREQHYRDALARQQEAARLRAQAAWLNDVPLKALVQRGWVPACDDPVAQARAVLHFFGLASPEQWRSYWNLGPALTAFRATPAAQRDPGAVAAWLRRGELEAQQIACAPYDGRRFAGLLPEARALTNAAPVDFLPRLQALCASAGVALVVVPELPRTRVSGATRWLAPHKALIQLSLRYKTDDQFWFTFFHEAGHILLHGKRAAFLDQETLAPSRLSDEDAPANELASKEAQANGFAADTLVAPAAWQRFVQAGDYVSRELAQQFASTQGIAPGIVVGRLQHESYLPWKSPLNSLKQRLDWAALFPDLAS